MSLKNVSGQSYTATIRTFGSSLVLTKSFTCVIVSGWCNQVGIRSVFEDVKAWRILSSLWKFIPIKDSRRQERCIVMTRIRCRSEELRKGYVDALPTVAGTREAS